MMKNTLFTTVVEQQVLSMGAQVGIQLLTEGLTLMGQQSTVT